MASASTKRVIRVYVASGALATLAASIIWGVHTLFMLEAGLDILQVMLVNTAFTFCQLLFEVPTGVVADTLGRKVSYLTSIGLIGVSTLALLAAGRAGLGIPGFVLSSVLLALGWTFQTGSVEAWLVDSLDHAGWMGPKDRVFALGGISTQVTMFVGTLLGGALGQVDLAWPFYARAALLAACFLLVLFAMDETGFERRELSWRTFGAEASAIFHDGVRYGWRNRVIRPLLFEAALLGGFFMYGFYSLQPYLLELLGRDLVWVAAAVTGGGAMAGAAGNALAGRLMDRERRPRAPRVLFAASAVMALAAAGVGVAGLLERGARGIAPFAVVCGLWVVMSFSIGVMGPVRRAYINAHIPSRQRATVLSFDALFEDAGATGGQPVLGWLSRAYSIPAAWLLGGAMVFAALPLYRRVDRADNVAGPGGAPTGA